MSLAEAPGIIAELMTDIQDNIYNKAKVFQSDHTTRADTYEEFKNILESKSGFDMAHWDGTAETEESIKQETKATIRCIPFGQDSEEGVCIYTGKPSKRRVVFAKAY